MNHYVFDCKCNECEPYLNNCKYVFYTLERMCRLHGLNPISFPVIRPYYECSPIDAGISAFVLLENGGHITFHSFDKRKCYYMDLLTNGNEFDTTYAFLKKFFPFDEEHSNIRSISAEKNIVEEYDENKHFGPHVVYKIVDKELSFENVFDFLAEFPSKINMTPIIRPYVVKNKKFIDGIVIIAESHVSVHHDIEGRITYVDIFSCMPFDFNNIDTEVEILGNIKQKSVYARWNKMEIQNAVDKSKNGNRGEEYE